MAAGARAGYHEDHRGSSLLIADGDTLRRIALLLALGLPTPGCSGDPTGGEADLGTSLGGGDMRGTDGAGQLLQPDLTKLVPWRAVNLIGPTSRPWEEYDYRPRAQGGFREDIDATLDKLKALGVRQVQIQTVHAWSVESTESAPYKGSGILSAVSYDAAYRAEDPKTWGKVPRTRRGDMGLVAFQPPASWDQPRPLATPLSINQKAEQVLGEMLDAVAGRGLIPVLKVETFLVLATDATGVSPSFNYTDPSRNFDQFYRMHREHLLAMTRVAARHQAALLILGTETPYVAGAGQARFANGEAMPDRQGYIAARWAETIQAVRETAQAEGRPDLLLSYTEINPFWEPRATVGAKVPPWQRVPFWDALDAVGINFYFPGRATDVNGVPDRRPLTADDMVAYGETHNFATDGVPNLQEIGAYFAGRRGYSLTKKPVIIPEDGCTASPYGAGNPAAPTNLTLRQRPDTAEQQRLYEAHFRQAERHGGGWLAGLGLWQVPPTSRWGGAYNSANTTNYSDPAAYFTFLGTPAEATVRTYFNKEPPRAAPHSTRVHR